MPFPIEAQGVFVRFGVDPVLLDINLRIAPGETVCLLGPSGSGKTTLLKCLAGLAGPTLGRILYDTVDIYQSSEKKYLKLQKKTGYVFQDGALLANLTVFENIALPLRYHGKPDEETLKRKVETAALPFLLTNRLHLRPEALSGGAKRLAGFARALIMDPEVLFVDDPTWGLDQVTADTVVRVLREKIAASGMSTIYTSGDITAARLADRVILLYDGSMVGQGRLDEIMETDDPFIRRILVSIEQPHGDCGGTQT